MTSTQAYAFTMQLPVGCTRREAGATVHRAFSKLWKGIEPEAQRDYVDSLRPLIDSSALEKVVTEQCDLCHLPDLSSEFGLVSPLAKPSREAIEQLVQTKYVSLYAVFEKGLQRRAQQAAEAKERLDKLNEQVVVSKPADLFDQAIEAKLCAK